jgi:Histidine kinase-, DNA gyrase B-, and HSP90-like ATPase
MLAIIWLPLGSRIRRQFDMAISGPGCTARHSLSCSPHFTRLSAAFRPLARPLDSSVRDPLESAVCGSASIVGRTNKKGLPLSEPPHALSYAPIVVGKIFARDYPACRRLVAQSVIDKFTYGTVALASNGYNYLLFHITFVWFGRPRMALVRFRGESVCLLRSSGCRDQLALGFGGLGRAARIFDAYQTTKPRGMRLGLPPSQRIVQRHAGRIWWESNRPEGARFVVVLPIDRTGQNAG